MKKLRVVQVGVAHDHAADTMKTLRAQRDWYEVLGVCEPDLEYRVQFRNADCYSGLPWVSLGEALDFKPDAVIVESDELKSVEYAQLFADAGIPVHLDKPGGTDYAAFQHLVETLRGKGLPFHMGYMYRFNPSVKRVKAMAERGELGEIFSVEAHMSCSHSDQKRAWLSRFPGGAMFFLGCHLIDLIYMLRGEPQAVIPFNAQTMANGSAGMDYGFAVLQYENGVSFAKTCCAEIDGFSRRQVVVTGSRGSVVIQPTERGLDGPNFPMVASMKISMSGKPVEQEQSEVFGRYWDMMRDFAEIVSEKRANPYDYDYELNVQRLVLRACGCEIDGKVR